ncbi:hypothetical protein, partial [Amphiplicatus metriothermophilus]|uniref:hypothetical protein n=1 Tax=Amphiplicatus metriothermophilus TaxID=1519374 RepID=UPI001C88C2DF
QNANDLFFAEPAALHRPSPLSRNRLTSEWGGFRGAGQQSFPGLVKTQLRSFPDLVQDLRGESRLVLWQETAIVVRDHFRGLVVLTTTRTVHIIGFQ